MKTEKDEIGFWTWVKGHKKQLAIAGISIAALASLVLGLKNRDAIMELWAALKKNICEVSADSSATVALSEHSVEVTEIVTETATEVVNATRSYTPPQSPVYVRGCIRNLPKGQCHSAAKADEAAALNIDLPLNQTLVNPYTKYAA